jgi:hypothetical protein
MFIDIVSPQSRELTKFWFSTKAASSNPARTKNSLLKKAATLLCGRNKSVTNKQPGKPKFSPIVPPN